MKNEIVSSQIAPSKMTYEDVRCCRMRLDEDVAEQQKILLSAIHKTLTPQSVIKAVSGAVVEQVVNDFSIFNLLSRGNKWLRLGMRIAKHLM